MSLRKEATFNIIGRLFELLFTMATPIILVRVFSQNDYGLYQQALIIGTAITSLLGFNIVHNLFYFYPIAKNNNQRIIYISHTYFLLFFIGASFAIVLFLLKPIIQPYITTQYFVEIYYFIIFYVLLTLMSNTFNNFFVIEGKAKIAMWFYGINKIIRVICILTAAIVFKTPVAALWGIILYLLLLALFFYIYFRYNYNISPFRFDKTIMKKQLKYIFPFGLSRIVGTIGNYSDKLIITAFLPARDLAIYSIGNFRIPLIGILYSSVGNVILPKISEYSKLPNGKLKAFELWKKLIINNIVITLPILIFSFYYAYPIITLIFGNEYGESAIVFRIMILIFLIQMFGFGYLLRGFGMTRPILPANIVKMVLSIILGGLFVYLWGYKGAAISYVIAFTSNGVIQLVVTRRFLEIPWRSFLPWFDIIKIFIASIISLLISLIMNYYEISTLLYLISTSIIYFIIVYVFLYYMNYLPSLFKMKSLIK